MPTQITIAITKEIIEKCKHCGNTNNDGAIGENCAIAFAVNDIFPNVCIGSYFIFPFGVGDEKNQNLKIALPLIAQQFIKLFDGFCLTPRLRLMLPAFEFAIDIPDEVIEQINIDEVKELIEGERKFKHKAHQQKKL